MLVKFAAYVPELHMSRIDFLYFYNANMAFKQSANKFENMSKVFSHIKVRGGTLSVLLGGGRGAGGVVGEMWRF